MPARDIVDRLCAAAAEQAWRELPGDLREKLTSLGSVAVRSEMIQCLARRLVFLATAADRAATIEAIRQPAPRNQLATAATLRDALPMMCGIIDLQVSHWRSFLSAFATHAAHFKAGWSARISSLQFDCSDPHSRGRTAVRVEFVDGSAWYYKPRPRQQEVIWNSLLAELNAAGFQPSLLPAQVLASRTHSWAAEIKQRRCETRGEVERFYARSGALLYLAHLLRAVDLHAGNFIAAGEHPVLIDCETLLHPSVRLPPGAPDQTHSLGRTGILCVRRHPERNCAGFLGRDASGPHSVYLRTRRVRASDAIAQLIDGFEAAADFIRATSGHAPIARLMRRLQAAPTRIVYRPTAVYGRVLAESLSAQFGGSKAARSYFIASRLERFAHSKAVLREEVAQLMRCDIPIFHGRAAVPRRPLSAAAVRQQIAVLTDSCAAGVRSGGETQASGHASYGHQVHCHT